MNEEAEEEIRKNLKEIKTYEPMVEELREQVKAFEFMERGIILWKN